MHRTYSFLTLLVVVAVSIVFGMVIGGKLNAPRLALAAPQVPDLGSGPSLPLAPAMVGDGRLDFADIAEAALPAVVGVANNQRASEDGGGDRSFPDDLFHRWFFGPQQPPERFERQLPERDERRSFGSGFLVSADGYVLSNNHVVEASDRLVVTMNDGTRYEAAVVGSDPSIDLALLKIESEDDQEFPYLELGDSDALRVGEWVLAIGNPLGFEQSVTVGVVSAKNRRVGLPDTDVGVASFIQTDAAINFGNSGGPLLDAAGRVVGINTAINRANMAEGIGFALQIDEAQRAMEQLLETGEVRRGLLGVTMDQAGGIDRDAQKYYGLPDANGVLIERVTAGGPADQAGIRAGDVIRKIDGVVIRNNEDLLREISSRKPGESVTIEVFRKGKSFTADATLTDRATALQNAGVPSRSAPQEPEEEEEEVATGLGITVETFDRDSLGRELRREADTDLRGVLVTGVEFGSQAADKGVEPGQVVTAVNDRPVKSLQDWRSAMERVEPGSVVKLDVSNLAGSASRFVFLTAPED